MSSNETRGRVERRGEWNKRSQKRTGELHEVRRVDRGPVELRRDAQTLAVRLDHRRAHTRRPAAAHVAALLLRARLALAGRRRAREAECARAQRVGGCCA